VLFTKTQRVNAAVAKIFSKRRGVKIYQAITVPRSSSRRQLQTKWTIRNYLGKISSKGKRAKYRAVDSSRDLAETSFRLIAEHLRRGLHIEAIPKTGRTHQIRVHLSEYGLPIRGVPGEFSVRAWPSGSTKTTFDTFAVPVRDGNSTASKA